MSEEGPGPSVSPGITSPVNILPHEDELLSPSKSIISNDELNKIAMVSSVEVEIDGDGNSETFDKSEISDPLEIGVELKAPVAVTTKTGLTSGAGQSSSVGVKREVSSNHGLISKPTGNILPAAKAANMKSQDVRVDNWGNYCLQRLQVMYDRGDFCDLILQFNSGQTLKVHRVVVNLCTEYFANLERIFGLTDGMLILPKDIEYATMVTIIKFFYTGKLEVKGPQFNDIYKTVKMMNIVILTKLLEAHARKPEVTKKETNKPIVFKQSVEIGRPLQKLPIQIQQGTVQAGSTIKLASPGSLMSTKGLGGRPLPPGVKTKTVLARVQPQTMKLTAQQLQNKLGQKKLPIWKERKYSPVTNSETLMTDKWPRRDEPARPTRFEWPDPDEDTYVTPASHALMDRQKAAASSRKAEDIFDAVKNQNQGVKRTNHVLNTSGSDAASTSESIEEPNGSPAPKVMKLDVTAEDHSDCSQDNMNMSTESSMSTNCETSLSDVNLTDEVVEEVVSTTESFMHDTDTQQETSQDDTNLSLSSEVPSVLIETTVTSSPTHIPASTPSTSRSAHLSNASVAPKRPSLKIPGVSTVSSSPKVEKSVRFAPEIEKENNKTKSALPVALPAAVAKTTESPKATNHSRIISEVLKKYPDLVKDNKNIKLKIVQKESDLHSASASKDGRSKVSYIVLKSTSAPDSAGTVVPKKPVMANRAFWDSDKAVKKPPSGAENTTGPWFCIACGTDEIPIEFDTYYNYRRHLVDVHAERIDARICEYCGQKASKRNLLLYHLYTKHGVTPPKNCVFPHCDRCDYVALSESLLTKHKQGHDLNKEYACTICNASFKSNTALQEHMTANLHRNKETKVYECPYCRKPFVRNINLKAHIRSLHKDVARPEEMDDPRLPPEDSVTGRGVSSMQAGVKKRQFPAILTGARIQGGTIITESTDELGTNMEGFVRMSADGQAIEIVQGIDHNMHVPVLVPSSEAEALSNVASSITASLGLDAHGQHMNAEYVTGVHPDGTQAVFIMDNSHNAVEVDLSSVGMTSDGSMIFEGGDGTGASDQFIVQDLHGNQFRKITGIDETGKQVIFFQLQDENGQVQLAPAILDDSVARYEETQADGTTQYDFESGHTTFSVQNDHMYLDPQKCSVFVSSDGVTLPVTMSSDVVGGQPGQVLISNLGGSVPPGHVLEFHTSNAVPEGHEGSVLVSEGMLNQGQVQLHALGAEHGLLQAQGQVEQMGQLHIVLGQNTVETVDGTMKDISPDDADAALTNTISQEEVCPSEEPEAVIPDSDDQHEMEVTQPLLKISDLEEEQVSENDINTEETEILPVEIQEEESVETVHNEEIFGEMQEPESVHSSADVGMMDSAQDEVVQDEEIQDEEVHDQEVHDEEVQGEEVHDDEVQEQGEGHEVLQMVEYEEGTSHEQEELSQEMEVEDQVGFDEAPGEEYAGQGLGPSDVNMGSIETQEEHSQIENEGLEISEAKAVSQDAENQPDDGEPESSSLSYETETQELMVEDATVDIA